MAAPLPNNMKTVQPFLKVANDMRKKEPVVAYYCDMHAMQMGMKIDSKSPDSKNFLLQLMGSLEKQKANLSTDPEKKEQISSEVVGETIVEEQALKLFGYADTKDRNSEFGKNVVRAFYTSSVLYDVAEGLTEELSEEARLHRKYARWKATYIHNCLKNGETPQPGPVGGLEDSFESELDEIAGPSTSTQQPYVPPPADTPPTNPSPAAPQPPRPAARSKPPDPAPAQPAPVPVASYDPSTSYTTSGEVELTPAQYNRAQKLVKYAGSAIMYQDVPTALENLEKCIRLLKTGKEDP